MKLYARTVLAHSARIAAALAISWGLIACASKSGEGSGDRTWIEAAGEDQPVVLARHLRGLDVAMLEIDHRYVELYFAGREGNWPYASYQADKLRQVMDLALERRPARAASAQAYFYPALAAVQEVVQREDAAAFGERFQSFAEACQACHAAEQVPSFGVRLPEEPRSSIRLP